jgi:Pvc16 N-terminal domain
MSDYTVLAAVSGALRDILWQEFQVDPVIAPIVGSESAIVFANPTETARDSANRLSIWLYQVTENEFVKNQPMLQANGGELQYPPLALDLSYLLTPFGTSGEADHLLLGKSMQVLYDNAITLLRDPVSNVHEELRIVLARLPLNELSHVWESLREPYRLSVAYQIRVSRVDSLRLVPTGRVVDRVAGYGDLSAADEVLA